MQDENAKYCSCGLEKEDGTCPSCGPETKDEKIEDEEPNLDEEAA